MSYDMEFGVKVDTGGGPEIYAVVERPACDNPTYNYGKVFRKAMGWDFEQGVWYPLDDAIGYFEHGLNELLHNIREYDGLWPENGFGTPSGAVKVMSGFISDAYELFYGEYAIVPHEYVYMSW